MKISYQWLQDYCKTNLTPEELAERFRLTSSEVESVESWQEKMKGFVIGKVLTVSKHPNADKLRLAKVDVGTEVRQIVCGATNLAEDQTVVVALPGCRLHNLKGEEIVLKESNIRGELSLGMLCAAEEISLPLPSDGILEIEGDFTPGTPAAQALNLDDSVLDLEITPNRPDLLSYFGLAREISCFDKKRLTEPPISALEIDSQRENNLEIHIDPSTHCLRYSALCLEDIKIAPSPLWLQLRLILSDVKPINNVVDITNYVMLELGQPLHAFDRAKINGNKIYIRSAKVGEKINVLDNTTRQLEVGDIVIADHQQAIALAGIIGGKDSAIDAQTTSIILESATFHGPQIRRTSRRLGLRTEASTRFEKGLDSEITITALKRAAYLLESIAGAKIKIPINDLYPHINQEKFHIHVSFDRIQQLTGVYITASECKTILQKLGFQISKLNKSSFEVTPPSWRKDVSLMEDIVEELIRIWGFDRIPRTLPKGEIKSPEPNPIFDQKQIIRQSLASFGLHETIHLSFISKTVLEKALYPIDQVISLPNPLSQETEFLLPSHLLSFLQNAATVNKEEETLTLFEIGKVFTPPKKEASQLSILLKSNLDSEDLYRFIKTILNRIFQLLSLEPPEYQVAKLSLATFQSKTGLNLLIQNQKVGIISLINPEIMENFKIRNAKSILFASLDLDTLLKLPKKHFSYQPANPYPSIERDLSLIVPQTIPVAQITELIQKSKKQLQFMLSLKTIYRGQPLSQDQKSVTLHFSYFDPSRTLEDREVNADQERIIKICQAELAAQIN
jgi:phenylalanyl-tRNA synthetase beta chain